MWLEMSREPIHGGGEWAFTRTLWSPTRKRLDKNGRSSKWAFWESLLEVRAGDLVVHLRGEDEEAAFVGYSIADAEGEETDERPPEPGIWSYATSFYRVPLRDYVELAAAIPLTAIFARHDLPLRHYFAANEQRHRSEKELLFYVVQSKKLQCLNGAYLSTISDELSQILLDGQVSKGSGQERKVSSHSTTSEQIRALRVRAGQQAFSFEVKKNFKHQCCFPGCSIAEQYLLVGAHIARWADAEHLRGHTSNGLCLCLVHDKAFERGLFTLTADYEVAANKLKVAESVWAQQNILPFDGSKIGKGTIDPALESLKSHWARIKFVPTKTL